MKDSNVNSVFDKPLRELRHKYISNRCLVGFTFEEAGKPDSCQFQNKPNNRRKKGRLSVINLYGHHNASFETLHPDYWKNNLEFRSKK